MYRTMRHALILALAALLVCGGCFTKRVERDARAATEARNWDRAYELWSNVLEEAPDDTKAKLERERARMNAALNHLGSANDYYERRLWQEANFEVNLVLSFDPDNQEARRLQSAIKRAQIREKAERQADADVKAAPPSSPLLSPKTMEPLNLYFPKPTSVKDIYLSLGRAYEVNIIPDAKLRNDKITLDLRNLNFLKALDTLMVLNRHFFKIIDHNTIIILEDNKANRDRYDNQIVQTFYLSNITPKDLKTHLRQLGDIKEFAENERLNAITIKGTPQQIALARKIIAANDKAQPEVVIEFELLEVNKNSLRRIGIQPVGQDGQPLYRAGLIASPRDRSDDDADLGGLRGIFPSLDEDDFLTIVPSIAINFLKDQGDSRQVANPHLRLTSGETGTVRIGQSIPIANTRFTNAQISGSASGGNNFGDQALTTFNYSDIGINIQVTPRVHYNGEVTLSFELEVSSVLSGGFQPTLGKRFVTSSLRLRNGETNVMAGLLSNEERKSLTGFPGLSKVPILGRLFSSDETVVNQTDIIMTIRPVIVRGPEILDSDRAAHEISDLSLSTLYGEEQAETRGQEMSFSREDDLTEDGAELLGDPFAVVEEDPTPRSEASTDNESAGVADVEPRTLFDRIARPKNATAEPEANDADDFDESTETVEPPPAMLAFMPARIEARQDDLLELQVFVTNVAAMQRGEIVIQFDPDILQAENVEIGNFFNAGNNRRPLLTPAWDNNTGRLSMIITQRSSGQPFSGSGILANIRLRAAAPGDGTLTFEKIDLTDPDDQTIATDGLTANYEISP